MKNKRIFFVRADVSTQAFLKIRLKFSALDPLNHSFLIIILYDI